MHPPFCTITLTPTSDLQVPARYYFVFGRPIDTQSVDGGDREACQRVYDQARLSVESGIEYLRAAREQDPYADGAKRLMYETVMRTQVRRYFTNHLITERRAVVCGSVNSGILPIHTYVQ